MKNKKNKSFKKLIKIQGKINLNKKRTRIKMLKIE